MQDKALAQLDVARTALAECRTAMEAKNIADVAEAARVYFERTNASAETVNNATEIRLLAERQMGEFLKAMPKNEGTRVSGGTVAGPVVDPPDRRQTLQEIGITKDQSSRAQKLAGIPDHEFQERIAVAKTDGGKLTTSKVLGTPERGSTATTTIAFTCADVARECTEAIKQERATKGNVPWDRMIALIVHHFLPYFKRPAEPKLVKPVAVKPPRPTRTIVEQIFDSYPRKIAKIGAIKAISNAIRDLTKETGADPVPYLLERTQAYAAAVAKWPASARYPNGRDVCPHPATWFSRGSYTDDPREWVQGAPVKEKKKDDYKKF